MEHTDAPQEPAAQLAALKGELGWWRSLAIVMLIVGGGVAFLLLREVRSHRADNAQLDVLQKQIEAMGGTLLGSRVDDLALVDAAGAIGSTAFAGSPLSLVVLLSTQCPSCEATAPAWAQIAGKLEQEGVPTRMIVVDAVGAPQDAPRWAGLTPHGVRDAERTWLREVPGVPAGVLVDSTGVVRRVWLRQLDASEVDRIVAGVVSDLRGQ
ncbi:MAG TPA: hypothetical protein VHN77_03000 [Phycisphaerales bacterium]|nr:hypothetical protein [Phycisphaerales bacterium]